MFDAIIHRGYGAPPRYFGTGGLATIVVHAGAIGLGVWMSAQVVREKLEEVKVTFVKQAPAPSPKPAPPKVRPKVKAPEGAAPMVLQQAIIAPREIPTDKLKESDALVTTLGGEGGDGFGDVANVAGGIHGPIVDAADVAATPMPFREEIMTRPEYLSGPAPEYTQKAIENQVQGLMVVKCVITIDGKIEDCRVLKSLPFMDRAVVSALERRRYKPVTLKGKPITVDYTFRINLILPQ